MRITVFGNCQSPVISEFIGLQCPQARMIPCPRVHLVPQDQPAQVFAAFEAADIVVHQPVSHRFGPIGMDALKARFPDKTYISFPSIFFAGLSPQMVRIKGLAGRAESSGWHDLRVTHAYLAGLTPQDCVARLNADDGDYLPVFDDAMARSLAYDAKVDVPVMDLVRDMMATGPMFHVANHPDNALLWRVAGRILDELGLARDETAVMPQDEYLAARSTLVPDTLVRALGYDWSRPLPGVSGTPQSLMDHVTEFYAFYDRAPQLGPIYKARIARLAPSVHAALRLTPVNTEPRAPVAADDMVSLQTRVARTFWLARYDRHHPDSTPQDRNRAWKAAAATYRPIAAAALARLDRQGIVFKPCKDRIPQ